MEPTPLHTAYVQINNLENYMTHTQIIFSLYISCLVLAVMAFAATMAVASEVTGTLSSDTTSQKTGSEVTGSLSSDTTSNQTTSGTIGGAVSGDTAVDGSLAGTVVGGSTGGGGGGSRSSGGGGGTRNVDDDSSDSPTGAVLGAADDNPTAPGFPNAGFAPPIIESSPTLWMTIVTFFKGQPTF